MSLQGSWIFATYLTNLKLLLNGPQYTKTIILVALPKNNARILTTKVAVYSPN